MKVKGLFGLFIIISLFTVFTGCGKSTAGTLKEPDSSTAPVQEEKGGTTVETPYNAAEESKNLGVIVDTVVDVFREPDVHSERVTQAIFNQPVEVLASKENWIQVKVVDGYTGWVKSKYVEMDTSSIKPEEFEYRLVTTSKGKSIYSQAKGGAALKDIVMGTEFFIIDKVESWYQVALPGKASGWVNESGTIRLASKEPIPKTSPQDLVSTANKLKGSVYLWGGVSNLGIDCSGLTYICSRINGINLPRDADQQFAVGQKIDKKVELIKEGDLVFFSTQTDLKDISHVGIYIGDNQFIHATKSKGSVVIGNIKDDYFIKRLVGVRRLF